MSIDKITEDERYLTQISRVHYLRQECSRESLSCFQPLQLRKILLCSWSNHPSPCRDIRACHRPLLPHRSGKGRGTHHRPEYLKCVQLVQVPQYLLLSLTNRGYAVATPGPDADLPGTAVVAHALSPVSPISPSEIPCRRSY